MALPAITTSCPCGHTIPVPTEFGFCGDDSREVYVVCNLRCPKCRRHSTGGNCLTGEVTSWITEKASMASEAEYQRQLFESDMNEWYGRGEW